MSVRRSVRPCLGNAIAFRPTRSDLCRVYGHVVFFYFCFVIPQSHSVSWLGQGIASLRQVKPAHVMPGQAGSSRPKSYRHIASGRAWSSEVSPGLLTCLSAKDSRRIRRLSLPIRPIRRWIARSFPSRNRSFAPSLLGPKKCCRTLDCI